MVFFSSSFLLLVSLAFASPPSGEVFAFFPPAPSFFPSFLPSFLSSVTSERSEKFLVHILVF